MYEFQTNRRLHALVSRSGRLQRKYFPRASVNGNYCVFSLRTVAVYRIHVQFATRILINRCQWFVALHHGPGIKSVPAGIAADQSKLTVQMRACADIPVIETDKHWINRLFGFNSRRLDRQNMFTRNARNAVCRVAFLRRKDESWNTSRCVLFHHGIESISHACYTFSCHGFEPSRAASIQS